MATASPQPSRRGLDIAVRRVAVVLPSLAGVLGGCGILVSAAAAHLGGTSLASTGGLFLLLHAATVLALAALAESTGRRRYIAAGLMLAVGTIFFSGDLTLAGLYGWRPFPPAAPIGGLLLIAGWLAVPVAAVVSAAKPTRV